MPEFFSRLETKDLPINAPRLFSYKQGKICFANLDASMTQQAEPIIQDANNFFTSSLVKIENSFEKDEWSKYKQILLKLILNIRYLGTKEINRSLEIIAKKVAKICDSSTGKVAIYGEDFHRSSSGFMHGQIMQRLNPEQASKICAIEDKFYSNSIGNKLNAGGKILDEVSDIIYVDDWILGGNHFERYCDYCIEANDKGFNFRKHSMLIASTTSNSSFHDHYSRVRPDYFTYNLFSPEQIGISQKEIGPLISNKILPYQDDSHLSYLCFIAFSTQKPDKKYIFVPDNASALVTTLGIRKTFHDWPVDTNAILDK